MVVISVQLSMEFLSRFHETSKAFEYLVTQNKVSRIHPRPN